MRSHHRLPSFQNAMLLNLFLRCFDERMGRGFSSLFQCHHHEGFSRSARWLGLTRLFDLAFFRFLTLFSLSSYDECFMLLMPFIALSTSFLSFLRPACLFILAQHFTPGWWRLGLSPSHLRWEASSDLILYIQFLVLNILEMSCWPQCLSLYLPRAICDDAPSRRRHWYWYSFSRLLDGLFTYISIPHSDRRFMDALHASESRWYAWRRLPAVQANR